MADEEFALVGLTSSYAFLLMTVNEKQGIHPKEISFQMQLTPSTVTRLIEKLEYRGLVFRKHLGRITEVYSTEKGQNLQDNLKKAWLNLFERYTNVLGKEYTQNLTAEIYKSAQLLE
ncbi:MAG: MarR family winged helix-turn-helix transcriptional regulator [Lutibacter sp.]